MQQEEVPPWRRRFSGGGSKWKEEEEEHREKDQDIRRMFLRCYFLLLPKHTVTNELHHHVH